MQGGLFVDRCQVCGWVASGTCSPTIDDLPRAVATRVSVRWENSKMALNALEVLRGLSPPAKAIPVVELSKMMVSGRSFEVGVIMQYRLEATVQALEDAGYSVTQKVLP